MAPITLVTGGSRGIGRAVALQLATTGHRVALSYRTQHERAFDVVRAIEARGGEAVCIQADVASEKDVERLFTAVDKRLGTVTGLVNNAAMLMAQSAFVELDARRIERVLAVNVVGAFLCAREAVRRMSTRTGGVGGSIVNVSSAAARLGSPGEYIDYAASKGAVDTMTRGLALEVADQGIRVNAVRPGFIDTQLHADGGDPSRVSRLAPSLPMGRGGQPEEVAEAICWLLSSAASYATGCFLDLAGGR
jgi:NAD(P)-dependent dehydrogenase (short-subunit alcohol dehydrogenase family)